ncbi:MAG: hypothetical protein C4292_07195 [Nitrososphaera sp.]
MIYRQLVIYFCQVGRLGMDGVGCKYAGFCRYYNKERRICSDEEKAEAYCDTFEVFDDFKPDRNGLMKKLFVA